MEYPRHSPPYTLTASGVRRPGRGGKGDRGPLHKRALWRARKGPGALAGAGGPDIWPTGGCKGTDGTFAEAPAPGTRRAAGSAAGRALWTDGAKRTPEVARCRPLWAGRRPESRPVSSENPSKSHPKGLDGRETISRLRHPPPRAGAGEIVQFVAMPKFAPGKSVDPEPVGFPRIGTCVHPSRLCAFARPLPRRRWRR